MKEITIEGRLAFVFDADHVYNRGGYTLNPQCKTTDEPDFWPLLVTTPETRTIKSAIIDCITSAADYLKVCSFILEDPEILNLLTERIRKQDVAVFVLTALNEKTFSTCIDSDEDLDSGRNEGRFQKHFDGIRALSAAGAYVRASVESHAKFVIADGNKAVLTSANVTFPSLNLNFESGVYLNKSDIIAIEQIFDTIYQRGTRFQGFEKMGEGTLVVDVKTELKRDSFDGLQEGQIIWTFSRIRKSLLEGIEAIVASADRNLLISTYSIVGLKKLTDLESLLDEFIQKKGNVSILTRTMDGRLDHAEGCARLNKIGCRILGDHINHSKGVIADGSSALLFTANIDGNHGLLGGFEVGVVLTEPESISSFKRFLEWQLNAAPYLFSGAATHGEKRQFYTDLYSRKQIIVPSELKEMHSITIAGKDQLISEFNRALLNDPPFMRSNDQASTAMDKSIRVGSTLFHLKKEAEGGFQLSGLSKHPGFAREYFLDCDRITLISKGLTS